MQINSPRSSLFASPVRSHSEFADRHAFCGRLMGQCIATRNVILIGNHVVANENEGSDNATEISQYSFPSTTAVRFVPTTHTHSMVSRGLPGRPTMSARPFSRPALRSLQAPRRPGYAADDRESSFRVISAFFPAARGLPVLRSLSWPRRVPSQQFRHTSQFFWAFSRSANR